jgi:DNA-binding NarL/FixJ family response regulator
MPERSDVLIADDHPEFRARLRQVLERSTMLRVVEEAADGTRAWELLCRGRPDIAILDIGMPGINGMDLARKISQHGLRTAVVFLTVSDAPRMIDEAVSLDMRGYLLKSYTDEEILKGVEAVAAGERCASPPVVSHIIQKVRHLSRGAQEPPSIDHLTAQEIAILRRIRQQKSTKEISAEMGIAIRTVDNHCANICRKLGLRGNYALRRFALDHADFT